MKETGVDYKTALDNGPEFCDTVIRCYLLPQAIQQAVREIDFDVITRSKKNRSMNYLER